MNYFEDEDGVKHKYKFSYLYHGWDYEVFGNDLDEFDDKAREMIAKNSAKPITVVNTDGEIVREYAERMWNFDGRKLASNFKELN